MLPKESNALWCPSQTSMNLTFLENGIVSQSCTMHLSIGEKRVLAGQQQAICLPERHTTYHSSFFILRTWNRLLRTRGSFSERQTGSQSPPMRPTLFFMVYWN